MRVLDFIKRCLHHKRSAHESYYDMEIMIAVPFNEPAVKYPTRIKYRYYPYKHVYTYYRSYMDDPPDLEDK